MIKTERYSSDQIAQWMVLGQPIFDRLFTSATNQGETEPREDSVDLMGAIVEHSVVAIGTLKPDVAVKLALFTRDTDELAALMTVMMTMANVVVGALADADVIVATKEAA